MPLGYVYEIYDKRTEGSAYVGSTTKHYMCRWGKHLMKTFQDSRVGRMTIHRYLKAQGKDLIHFGFRVREEVFWKTRLDLRKREQVWIDNLGPKCNVTAAYVTEEHKKKVRAAISKRYNAKNITCECGLIITQGNRRYHLKSANHAQLLKAKHS